MGKEVTGGTFGTVRQQYNKIARLANAMKSEMPEVDIKVTHHFAPNQYGREALIPAGVIVVGKKHRHSHINIISAGSCTVYTAGEGESFIEAPCTFVSKAGAQRVIVAHEELVWTTIHVTQSTNLEDIEREVIQED